MDRDAEIGMARTAAPASISKDASVMVLGPKRTMRPRSKARTVSSVMMERDLVAPFDQRGALESKESSGSLRSTRQPRFPCGT